jgi:heat shock protein HslJ
MEAMIRRYVLVLALPLTLSIVAAACGDDDDDAAAASGLDSTGWVLDDTSLAVDVPQDGMEEITISFTETDVAGNSGCNNYTSTYTVPGDGKIAFGEFVTTRKACDPAVMAVETAYLGQLAVVREYEIDGDDLVLSGDAGVELSYTKGG